ncbi:MAG: SUMF1/EgtB/PvdO family nonheme iron enzyme [Planctomycetia bacterium]|nr:SUMF1/EgtB/PvdO family nonheme iron enzyme [Planctomycetia bacterium]
MPSKQCPTPAELKTYAQRILPVEQAEEVTKHIATCADCEETVQEFVSASASNLVELIKASGVAQPYVDEAACLKVVESVKRNGPPTDGPDPRDAAAGKNSLSPEPKAARTMNRNEFVEFITTIGFVSAGEITIIDKQLPAEKAGDVQALAQALVQQGKLTKFQAAAVYQGKGKSLVYGDYLVLDRLGAGGMGQVFKARHRRLDRIVALKVLSPAAMKNADSVKRFEREARAAAKLIHPNIVHTYDAGAQDNVHYLVMEIVSGPDLSSLVKKQGKLDVKLACDYIAQAARGFAFAHSKGIVHRDIKPGNLLVDHDGTVKVLDMGLARFDDSGLGGGMGEAELTQSGAVMGTVDYMAPEQALNTSRADAKSDVYGLGCTLYRILTGESVFAGETLMEKLLAHREQPIPPLRRMRPDAPPALEALVSRMLSKQPDQRPTMQEVADALPGILEPGIAVQSVQVRAPAVAAGAMPTMVATQPKAKGAVPPKGRSKLPLLIASGAGGLLILGGILFIIRDKDGNKLAEVNAPDGSSVAVVTDPTAFNPTGVPPENTRPSGTAVLANPTPKPAPPIVGTAEPTATASAPRVASVTPAMPSSTPSLPSSKTPLAVPSANVATTTPAPRTTVITTAPVLPPRGGIPARAVAPFDAAQAKSLQAAWAAFLGQPEVAENAVGMKLALIPAGEFLMGSTPQQQAAALQSSPEAKYEKQFVDTEVPQHRVVLRSAYRIGMTEVTIREFREFVEATKYVTEREEPANVISSDGDHTWRAPGYPVTDHCPATCVTWNDAAAFCNWLSEKEELQPAYRKEGPWKWSVGTTSNGYRLPTEAEWEFACRAGTTTQFWYGDDYAKIPEFTVTKPGADVATKPANPFGLYDTSGNVWEWCQDIYNTKPYEPGTAEDPTGPATKGTYVIRGGAWRGQKTTLRSANRCGYDRITRNNHTGFRVVKMLGATKPAVTAVATTPIAVPAATPAAVNPAATSNRSSPTEILAFDFDPLPQELAVGQSPTMEFRVTNSKSQEFSLTGTYHHSDLAAFKPVAAVQVRLQCLEPGPDALLAATDWKKAPMTAAGIVVGAPRISSTNKTLTSGEMVKGSLPLRISALPVGRYVMTVTCVPTAGLGRNQYASYEFRIVDQPAATAKPAQVTWSLAPPALLATAPRLLPITDPERRAVLWALPLGAKLQIRHNGRGVGPNPLPDDPFTTRHIDFYENANNNESRRMITDADLENLVGLREINGLRLPYSQVTDAGLAHLSGLTTLTGLDLRGTKITDRGIARLAGLKDIKSLWLSGTEITDGGLEKIVAQFPLLSEPLEVNDTRITDAGAAHLRNAKSLRYLGLSGTEVTDACVPDLAAIPRLAGVDLIGTRVTEAGVAKLKAMLADRTVEIGFDPAKVKTGPSPTQIVAVPFASTTPTTPASAAAGTPASTSPSDTPAAPAGPSRLAVPDAKAQQAALQLIKEVYKEDYAAARMPDKKAELAEKLLEQSSQTTDPTDRYVLLNEARTFALDGDDQAMLRRVLTAIVTDFNVDTATVYIDSWKGVLAKSKPTPVAKGIYDDISAIFESAVAQGAFDEAKRFGDYALTVAPRIGDTTAVKTTRDRNTLLAGRQQEWTAAKAALAKLAANPDDAEANLAVGRYRALIEGDWPTAFPHLAKGSDDGWKDLAAKSVAVAADGAARTTLADAFWDASKSKSASKGEFAVASLYWYQAALPSLNGLQKARIEKRIAEATAVVPTRKLPPTPLSGGSSIPVGAAIPSAIPGSTAAAPAAAAGLPPADPRGPLGNAAYQKWLNEVAAMPVQQQVEAVSKKMVELNPGFDGKLAPRIEDGIVKEVNFVSTNVTNIYPIRAFPSLTVLICNGVQSKLFDLLPLQGMSLTSLQFTGTSVSDLSPLRGMRLTLLSINNTQVSDLSLLRGMPLTILNCCSTPVFDLAPLQDCKQLEMLDSYGSKVSPAMVDALRQVLPNCKFR